MSDNRDWEKIAKEYRKEIENLWIDIESALDHEYRGRVILQKSLEVSEKAVFEIEKFN